METTTVHNWELCITLQNGNLSCRLPSRIARLEDGIKTPTSQKRSFLRHSSRRQKGAELGHICCLKTLSQNQSLIPVDNHEY